MNDLITKAVLDAALVHLLDASAYLVDPKNTNIHLAINSIAKAGVLLADLANTKQEGK